MQKRPYSIKCGVYVSYIRSREDVYQKVLVRKVILYEIKVRSLSYMLYIYRPSSKVLYNQ